MIPQYKQFDNSTRSHQGRTGVLVLQAHKIESAEPLCHPSSAATLQTCKKDFWREGGNDEEGRSSLSHDAFLRTDDGEEFQRDCAAIFTGCTCLWARQRPSEQAWQAGAVRTIVCEARAVIRLTRSLVACTADIGTRLGWLVDLAGAATPAMHISSLSRTSAYNTSRNEVALTSAPAVLPAA